MGHQNLCGRVVRIFIAKDYTLKTSFKYVSSED